ncbi:MAG TPA: hypothetical protein VMH87_16670 [Pseudomonadales bacterium]|nr:hypothetical protein [Pseudomonadales bacterium]
MNNDPDVTRLFSTIVVWIAAAGMFIFGFTKLGATGYAIPLWGIIGLALVISPAVATVAIWKSKPNSNKSSDDKKN